MRVRRLLAAAAVVGAAAVVWAVLPLAAVEVDESGVPSPGQVRSLPSDVEVREQGQDCGSGGCWRSLSLTWPGHTSAQLLDRLGLAGDGTRQVCGTVSPLDRRVACLSTDDREQARAEPGTLPAEIWWRRPLGP